MLSHPPKKYSNNSTSCFCWLSSSAVRQHLRCHTEKTPIFLLWSYQYFSSSGLGWSFGTDTNFSRVQRCLGLCRASNSLFNFWILSQDSYSGLNLQCSGLWLILHSSAINNCQYDCPSGLKQIMKFICFRTAVSNSLIWCIADVQLQYSTQTIPSLKWWMKL